MFVKGLKKVQKNKESEFETCVICKCITHIPKNQPIKERQDYIVGQGQLCYACYKEVEDELEKQ